MPPKQELNTSDENELDENTNHSQDDVEQNDEQDNEPKSSLEAVEQGLSDDENKESGEAETEEGDDDNVAEGEASADDKSNAAVKPDVDSDNDDKPNDALNEDDFLKDLPKDTKKETAERFNVMRENYTALKNETLEITGERDALQEDVTGFKEIIDSSMASPDEFNELIDYSRMVKSGDIQGAMQVLDKHRSHLAKLTGATVEGVNQLEGHPDLQEQVDDYSITPEIAIETAALRNKSAMQAKQQEQHSQNQNNEAQQQKAQQDKYVADAQQAQSVITQLSQQWQKNDPQFALKQTMLIEKAPEIMKGYPPHLWAQATQDFYNTLQVAKPSPRKNTNQPLRSSGGNGGSQVATSSLDAVTNGLGMNT